MCSLDLKTFDKDIRDEIEKIYKDDVSKYRTTVVIAKKHFAKELEEGSLTCPICGKKIEKISTIHAKIHDYAKKGTVYWMKDNLVPMCSKACHEKDDLETYMVNGTEITFSKKQTGKDYRDYLKNIK